MQRILNNKSKVNRKRDEGVEPGTVSRVVGFLLIVLVSFPILSLVSYDWHDLPCLYASGTEEVRNLVGMAGAWGTFCGYGLFGLALWLLPIWMLLFGFLMVTGRLRHPWRRFGWAVLFQVCICALLEAGNHSATVESLNIKSAGGAFGWFLMTVVLKPFLGVVGGSQVVVVLMLSALVFGIGLGNWHDFFVFVREWLEKRRIERADDAERATLEELKRLREESRQRKEEEKERIRQEKEAEREAREAERERVRQEREEIRRQKEEERLAREREYEEQKERLRKEREAAEAARLAEEKRREEARRAEEARKAAEATEMAAEEEDGEEEAVDVPEVPAVAEEEPVVEEKPFELPTVDLLSPITESQADCGNTSETAELIAATLTEFKVPGIVTHIEEGPVITTYEFQPAPRIRPEQVSAMDKTLEMRIMAKSLRIEAPIPGKGVCGIEVPNKVARSVTVREILEGDVWKAMAKKLRLPLLLGKDASGHDLVVDLADMPHLLVAGATGSGKSVCMNAMLTGLLMSRTPDELKLILVDPKVVEFTGYNAIPHLVVPVITEPKKVALGLIWAIHEMEKRYKMLSAVGVKNIESFNNRKKIAVQQDMFEGFGGDAAPAPTSQYPDKLPYIVIVIDEMADLMLQVKKEVEDGITRLAQKSRAVGIHLILATQRPTVNIVTGTIKANIAGRIAFQVAQKNDSKVIIDRMGADTLIGKGDMLFLNPRTGKTVRAQGAFITDADAEAVTEYIRGQAAPKYVQEAQDQLAAAGADQQSSQGGKAGSASVPAEAEEAGDGNDELFEQAIAVIRRTRRASTSSLQRALAIGYNRAARIFDQLEERGIVGPSRGALPREILIDLDGEIPTNSASAEGGEEVAPEGEDETN